LLGAQNRKSERALFFTIWAVILVGIGIWKFQPLKQPYSEEMVQVLLSPEIRIWLNYAQVRSRGRNRYLLDLEITSEYRAALQGKPREIHLGYRMTNSKNGSERGVASFFVDPRRGDSQISLPNPKKLFAEKIELFLAK